MYWDHAAAALLGWSGAQVEDAADLAAGVEHHVPSPVGHLPDPQASVGSVHLKNALISPVFVFYVITGGHVPTESGRGQAERGARTEPVHEKGIRRSGGRLAATCRANGVA